MSKGNRRNGDSNGHSRVDTQRGLTRITRATRTYVSCALKIPRCSDETLLLIQERLDVGHKYCMDCKQWKFKVRHGHCKECNAIHRVLPVLVLKSGDIRVIGGSGTSGG